MKDGAMLKILVLTVSVLAFPVSAMGQSTTPVQDGIAEVVAACKATVDGDQTLSGSCSTAAKDYLESGEALSDEKIADLVVELVRSAQADTDCNTLDTEVASAVQMASTRATDPEQVERLENISVAVGACVDDATFDVDGTPPVGDQASPA